jgi:hypothetical protein
MSRQLAGSCLSTIYQSLELPSVVSIPDMSGQVRFQRNFSA